MFGGGYRRRLTVIPRPANIDQIRTAVGSGTAEILPVKRKLRPPSSQLNSSVFPPGPIPSLNWKDEVFTKLNATVLATCSGVKFKGSVGSVSYTHLTLPTICSV